MLAVQSYERPNKRFNPTCAAVGFGVVVYSLVRHTRVNLGVRRKGRRCSMRRCVCFLLIACITITGTAGEDPPDGVRPITLAKGVLAVWYSDWGLFSPNPGPHLIFAAWPDGHVVWSNDRVKGGPPYHEGHIDPAKVTNLLKRFESDGLYSDKVRNQGRVTVDSDFVRILIRYGNHKAEMSSSHELDENRQAIATQKKDGRVPNSKRRMDMLREEPTDQLLFRFVWADTRLRMTELLPLESSVSNGRLIMKAGIMSWQNDATDDKRDNIENAK